MKATEMPDTADPSGCVTLEDLARRTGEKPERLERWRDAGLIGTAESCDFQLRDVGRAMLLHDLLHYGITLDTIADAAKNTDSAFYRYLETMGDHYAVPAYSVQEAAERVGIDVDQARRLIDAGGVDEHGEMLDEADLRFLESCKVALGAGMPEEALLQILRVYSDNMSRIAEVGARVGHFYMHQPLMNQGHSPAESIQMLESTFARIEPLVEPAIFYFHHKGLERAQWEDMLMHLEEEAGLAEKPDTPGQVRQAIMFVDLASFTPLAEAMGDLRAAQVLQRFSSIVRSAARRAHGRIVKQIGDAFMLMFSEPHQAVICAVGLEAHCAREPQFPAVRAGIHWGPVLYREGDYFGSNVNVASRLAAEAGRHQILISGDLWRRVKDIEGIEFVRLGKRRLKGLAQEIEVYEARWTEPGRAERFTDPVCGMEIGPTEVAARLTFDGREHAFCSEDCLRKFVASPATYLPA
jgi:class 3 adenylate cyclase/YHS domain-containing protein